MEKAEYENRLKKRKQNFSRERKMPFKKPMRFMPGMIKESSQNALNGSSPRSKMQSTLAGRRSARRGKK
ncbi:MAG: hypothetical protein LBO04_03540 [Spirochaetaceae bacterium]|nr:hypothetical protein [Spirochaetaceae bacterium]